MRKLMNRLRWIAGLGLLGSALVLGVTGLVSAGQYDLGHGEEHESEHKAPNYAGVSQLDPSRAPGFDTYNEECGACHIAYPAGFLPQRSWNRILLALDQHFGENAELDEASLISIKGFLLSHAAETKSNYRSARFISGVAQSDIPLRITELSYFKRKHDEVPEHIVVGNPEVVSFSQCQACHGEQAQKGQFDEDSVNIPGYGRWDD